MYINHLAGRVRIQGHAAGKAVCDADGVAGLGLGREGHLVAVHGVAVEGDERPEGVVRLSGQVGEVAAVGVAAARNREGRHVAGADGRQLETALRDGHIVGVRDGGVQRGRGLADTRGGKGGYRRIREDRTCRGAVDEDVIQHDTVAVVSHAQEGKLVGGRRVRQIQGVFRPGADCRVVLRQELPVVVGGGAVEDGELVLIGAPGLLGKPVGEVRIGDGTEVQDGRYQAGGMAIGTLLEEEGVVGAAVGCADVAVAVTTGMGGPVQDAADVVLRPAIGHGSVVFKTFTEGEGGDGIAERGELGVHPYGLIRRAAEGLHTHLIARSNGQVGEAVGRGAADRHRRPRGGTFLLVLQHPVVLGAACTPGDIGGRGGDIADRQGYGGGTGERLHRDAADDGAGLAAVAGVVLPQEHQFRGGGGSKGIVGVGHHHAHVNRVATRKVELVRS